MRIKSVSVNHHKVLGSVRICFDSDSEILKENILEKYHSDIHVEIDNSVQSNQYTYIIGDNGIGKTVLFRSVINFINWNSTMANTKLKDMIDFYPKNVKYREYASKDQGYNELTNLSIYNKYFTIPGLKEYDFLKYYDAQAVFITSSTETGIVHQNSRFRSFNYLTEISQTKYIFLRALIKYNHSEQIDRLNNLLGEQSISWKLFCGLSHEAVGEIEKNKHTVLMNNFKDVNIFNFLETIRTLKVNDDQILDSKSINDKTRHVFEAIYNSGNFFKLYFDANESLKTLFELLNSSYIINRIDSFLKSIDTESSDETLNVRINDLQKKEWDWVITDIDALNVFEVNVLGLMQALKLVDIDILGNDIPIDVMSSGQKNLIRLFSFFSDLPVQEKYDNCLVFFDEPENSLHPKWQQNFPQSFKDIVEKVYGITNSHFIFATHSPVLVMKSALIANSNLLRFYKTKEGQFRSESVKNVNAYSIEEVLLDEFKITYRDQGAESDIKKILDDEFNKRRMNSDPVDSIRNSFDLRDRINDLYNDIHKGS